MASMHVAKMQKETLIHSANAMNQHGLVTNAANFGFERLLLVLYSFWQILLFYFEKNTSKNNSKNLSGVIELCISLVFNPCLMFQ